MKFKFQTFVDLQTSAQSMQIIQWSVGGSEVLRRCRHLFGAYKYFKLGKISIKLVPASTLPVDPVGLSYDLTDPQTVDPRDQMNPGLVRITNGEDIYTNISGISADNQMNMYNSMMLDPRWSKFMLQSGFRRSAYPMYWQVGQLSQDKYPGTVENVPTLDATGSALNLVASVSKRADIAQSGLKEVLVPAESSPRGLFQTGHRGKLGYLPTDYYQDIYNENGDSFVAYGHNNIPEVSVVTCVLPKAYKTIYYYRCFITEEVYFTGLRSAPYVDGNNNGWLGIDNFTVGTVARIAPGQGMANIINDVDMNNGGDLP